MRGAFFVIKTQIKISPFLTCFPYRRSPSAYFEGTHGDRVAGDNTDAIDFVAIASSLRATNGRRAVSNTNRLKAVPLRLRGGFATECHAFSYKTSSFDARFSRRLAARVPSSNRHIPFISRLRISVRLGCGV